MKTPLREEHPPKKQCVTDPNEPSAVCQSLETEESHSQHLRKQRPTAPRPRPTHSETPPHAPGRQDRAGQRPFCWAFWMQTRVRKFK